MLFNVVLIETHNVCTRRCWFCKFGQQRQDNVKQQMSEQTLLRIADNLHTLNYSGRISPFGINEPLLDPRIVDIIKLFRHQCPAAFLSLNSNSDLLTTNLLNELFEAGLNAIGLSIYDNLGFKRLAGYAHDPRVVLIDMRQPEHHLENRGGQVQTRPERFHPEQVRQRSCYRPFTMLTIRPAGNVVLCCSDMYGDVEMGNIWNAPLEAIWFSDKFNHYRRELQTQGRANLNLCQNCSHSGGTSSVSYPLSNRLSLVQQLTQ